MKKRSHLSDSSSLHLTAPFKNTLYFLLTLKLHLSDSMMESPILHLFLPSFYILSLPAVSGASPVFPSPLPAVLAEMWKLSFSNYVRECTVFLIVVCRGGFHAASTCISVCMFNQGKNCKNGQKVQREFTDELVRVWRWEQAKAAGRLDVRAQRQSTKSSSGTCQ